MKHTEFAVSTRWFLSSNHNQLCQIIESNTLWGKTTCRVWLPNSNSVVTVSADSLQPLDEASSISSSYLNYVASAGKIADALTQDVLLADEVGLGKTIEAGLILRELKLRGLVKRTLVVAPKSLLTQWVAEMSTHFNEDFRLLIPGDFSAYRRIAKDDNIWQSHAQVVCPMDSVKPMESRRGWSAARVAAFNQERYEDLITAGWDLIIVDEAHRLGGSTDQVARFKLGQGLAEAAPYILLLSATPHQGKTDAFHRLLSLVDKDAFPDEESVTRERVMPYVIRTEKRRAITAEGKPLFKPRRTELAPISWGEKHRDQKLLYDAVTEYVREGYNQAVLEKRSYIGFLMILMQRLVVSSVKAIRVSLERRLDVLEEPEGQLSLFPMESLLDWADLDGQAQVDSLLTTHLKALKNERDEVKLLLEAARRCENAGVDAKAEALLEWIYKLQAEECDSTVKILVFTEFVPTQQMLEKYLTDLGFSVVCLNGSLSLDERKRVQEEFAENARILISTDAGGEGINLQFCHVVINYDIPWNPMRLEQRIGRVDRIGQSKVVRAINFVFEDSVEHRVREVLEEKLDVIFREFGIDKTGDVLDSAQAGRMFDIMHVEAILHPESIDTSVDKAIANIHEEAKDSKSSSSILGVAENLEPYDAQRIMAHPLPHWIEQMTVSYLQSHGGEAEKIDSAWRLKWSGKDVINNAVFSIKDANKLSSSFHLTLEDSRIRDLVMNLPRFVPGQPVAKMVVPGISKEISGLWSLWRISLTGGDWSSYRIMPLFLSDEDQVFAPTARHLWEQFMTISPEAIEYLSQTESSFAMARLATIAEKQGHPIFKELLDKHQSSLVREKENSEFSFAMRRKVIERLGLPQVKNHRLNLLQKEMVEWEEEFRKRTQAFPNMVPILILQVIGGDGE
ncbi:MAG: DEAD/DEAH box helicase [Candidatus Sabulitectum sp.]|nr:DEAD/DEAH box helicase [Candidatus Sabulitectum sp.]